MESFDEVLDRLSKAKGPTVYARLKKILHIMEKEESQIRKVAPNYENPMSEKLLNLIHDALDCYNKKELSEVKRIVTEVNKNAYVFDEHEKISTEAAMIIGAKSSEE